MGCIRRLKAKASAMQVQKVKYVLWAGDRQRCLRFYRELFGGVVSFESEVWSEIVIAGATLGIHGCGQLDGPFIRAGSGPIERIFSRKLLKRGGLLGITTTLSNKGPDVFFGFQDMSAGGSRRPLWMPAGTARILVELGEQYFQQLDMILQYTFVPDGKASRKASLAQSILFRLQ
jgi:hypothetical protein